MNILNSADTAATVNKIIHNAQGTTKTTEGATAAGKIIKEHLPDIISAGFDMPHPTSIFEGVPPFSFISNGEPLVNWIIYGNTGGVGEKTDNLYNANETEIQRGYIDDEGISHPATSGTTAYTVNFTAVLPESKYYLTGTVGGHRIYYYDENKTFLSRSEGMTATRKRFDTIENCEYIQIQFEYGNNTDDWMLSYDTEKSFEPYGYKIPVICGNTTTNIYIDEPLTSGETISYSETGVIIPTKMFLNTLSVDTTVQPEKVFIEYVK